ncbi:MAG: hypothetical protein KA257_05205 [Opitutaceae bacterium]|nr:hypothetical protein [Opitutaceae bacterium]MBP9912931.1 hypothetical protein [Opitutaceae bacterium]
MSDRLAELLRQRALLQQQADWLDREIAACTAAGQPSAPAPSPVVSTAAVPVPAATPSPELEFASAYTPDPVGTQRQVKRGCFIYFCIALVLLGAALFAAFSLLYPDRPMLFMEKDQGSPGNAQSES